MGIKTDIVAVIIKGQEKQVQSCAVKQLLKRGYNAFAISTTLDIPRSMVLDLMLETKMGWSAKRLDVGVSSSELQYALLHGWWECKMKKRLKETCLSLLEQHGRTREELHKYLKGAGFNKDARQEILTLVLGE